jgi:hypothetical protein
MKLITAKLETTYSALPDFSDLGHYTNWKPDEIRFEKGSVFKTPASVRRASRLKYFVCAVDQVADDLSDEEKRKEYMAQYERMLAYEQREWFMHDIWLELRIEIGGTLQAIVSRTVPNVPSDCDCRGDYAEELLDELEPVLKELGFSVQDVLELGLEI